MTPSSVGTAQLFVEIGCEELPFRWGTLAREHLAVAFGRLLEGIPHGGVRTWATPRRVAVAVDDVALARPLVERLVTGPAADRAFQAGKPTPAAEGFARGRGVSTDQLEIVDGPKGRVVAVRLQEGGEPTVQALAQGLEAAILGVPFPKVMRWGAGPATWARPIHYVCAVLGGAPIPTTVGGLPVGTTSTGHRRYADAFPVTSAEGWLEDLVSHRVMADPVARRSLIEAGLRQAAQEAGVQAEIAPELLDEVTDLVEWPVVVAGRLPAHLMHLPPRLLVESMRVHQRVFPTRDADGRLAPVFLTVSNNPDGDAAVISAGNTRVLEARFQDARFFYDDDRAVRLDAHGTKLGRMQWVRGLGTMAEKASRIQVLTEGLAALLGADPGKVWRAAELAKADLTSRMVGEFPELQGHVGRLYAAHQGEDPEVCLAIEEHYLPRFAGDALPTTPTGRVLALADRLDTLAGCFAIGLVPKGNADPQGLRRAANAVVTLLRQADLPESLAQLFDPALVAFEGAAKRPLAEVRTDLVEFVLVRLRAQLLADGVATELVDAVLAAGGDDVVRLVHRTEALRDLATGADFGPLRVAFRRVMGLTRDHASSAYDPDALAEPAERDLHAVLAAIRADVETSIEDLDYRAALRLLVGLKAPVDLLFDKVLVMDPDLDVRRNRLGLLRSVADLFRAIADFTRLSGEAG